MNFLENPEVYARYRNLQLKNAGNHTFSFYCRSLRSNRLFWFFFDQVDRLFSKTISFHLTSQVVCRSNFYNIKKKFRIVFQAKLSYWLSPSFGLRNSGKCSKHFDFLLNEMFIKIEHFLTILA